MSDRYIRQGNILYVNPLPDPGPMYDPKKRPELPPLAEDPTVMDYRPGKWVFGPAKKYFTRPKGPRKYWENPKNWRNVKDRGLFYWEDPLRVARYQQAINAQPPQLQEKDWLDNQTLYNAYQALRDYNGNEMWWNWRPLPFDDPISRDLRRMQAPPLPLLDSMDEGEYYEPAPYEELAQPDQAGMTDMEWGSLPRWQRFLMSALQSPVFGGVIGGIPGAMVGGALAGPYGAAGGAILGGGAGAYASQHPEGTLASLLMYLDIPREWMEQNLGMIEQVRASILDPGKAGPLPDDWDEVMRWLRAARQAGSVYTAGISAPEMTTGEQLLQQYPQLAESDFDYANWEIGTPGNIDFLNLMARADIALDPLLDLVPGWRTPPGLETVADPGEVWMAGQPGAVPAPDVGAAMVDMRLRILQGEDTQQVINEYTEKYGLTGSVREMVIGFVIDPINYTPFITNKGGTVVARAAGNVELATAFDTTHGLLEGVQKYGTILRATKPIDELAEAGAFTRWLTGVTKEGNVKILAPATDQGGIFRYLLRMKPQSRATEVVNTSAANLALVMSRLVDPTADELINLIKQLAETPDDLARELSMRSIQAPDGAAIPLFLRDFGETADEFLLKWGATEQNRKLLNNLAEVTGKSPAEVLQQIANSGDAEILLREFIDLARESGDDAAKNIVAAYDDARAAVQRLPAEEHLTGAKLQELVQVFIDDGLPHDMDTFRAQLYTAAMDVGADWAAVHFGVKPDPTWVRTSQMVKSAQSLMLLGLNPTYFVNNALNNMVTSAATGVFGLRTMRQIDSIWTRAGIEPPRLRAGVGPVSLGEELTHNAIREAVHTPGMLTDITRFFNTKTRKLQIFSNLSMSAEQFASAQAYTAGFVQFMGRHWTEGVGFRRMPAPLERALGQMDPELPRLIYSAIKGGMNQTEIEKLLWGGLSRRTIDHAIPTLVDRLRSKGVDLSEADITELLRHSGVDDLLREKLNKAKKDGDVRDAFSEANEVIQVKLDELVARDLEREAAEIAGRLSAEGLPAVLEIFDQRQLEFTERWFENFAEWEKAFQDTENLSYGERNVVMRHVASEQRRKWNRYYASERAKYQAIVRGLGIGGEDSRRVVGIVDESQQNMKKFYELRDKKNAEFFSKKFDNSVERKVAWDTLQDELMEAYNDMTSREVRLSEKLDQELVAYLVGKYGAEAGDAGAAWRKGVNEIRVNMIKEMRAMRDALRTMPIDERRTAWTTFLHGRDGYLTQIAEYFRKNVDGAHELYRNLRGREAPPAEVPPPGEPPPVPPEAPPGAPGVVAAAAEKVAEEAAAEGVAIPWIITHGMRAQMRALGYSAEQIRKINPDDMWKIIKESIPPEVWTKGEVEPGPGFGAPVAGEITEPYIPKEVPEAPPTPEAPAPEAPGPVQDLSPVGRKVRIPGGYTGVVYGAGKLDDGGMLMPIKLDDTGLVTWIPAEDLKALDVPRVVDVPTNQPPPPRAISAENARIAAEMGIPLIDDEGNIISGASIHLNRALKKYGGADADFITDYTKLEDVPTDLMERAMAERAKVKAAEAAAEPPKPDEFMEAIKEIEAAEEALMGDAAAELDAKLQEIGDAVFGPEGINALPDEVRSAADETLGEMGAMVDIAEPGYRRFDYVDGQGSTPDITGQKSTYPDWYEGLGTKKYTRVVRDADGKIIERIKFTGKDAVLEAIHDVSQGTESKRMLHGELVDYALVENVKGEMISQMSDKRGYQIFTGMADTTPQVSNLIGIGRRMRDAWFWDNPEKLTDLLNEVNDVIADLNDFDYEDVKIAMDWAIKDQETLQARIEELNMIPPEELAQLVENAERLARAEVSIYESGRTTHDFQLEQGVQPSELFQKDPKQGGFWEAGEDTPLFTGAAQKATDPGYAPTETPTQGTMPGFEPQLKGAKAGGEGVSGPLFDAAARAGIFRRSLRQKFIDYFLTQQKEVLSGAWDAQTQADNFLALADARAKVWARDTGRQPHEWYEATFSDVRRETIDVSNDVYLLNQIEATKGTEGYKAFADGNQVVDPWTGDLIVVYHGTTHEFSKFDPSQANIENFMGQAIYFTDSIDDVNANYAGFGPDLTMRIDNLAETISQDLVDGGDLHPYEPEIRRYFNLTEEQLENMIQTDPDRVIDMVVNDVDGLSESIATRHIAGKSEGMVMPVYLRMENAAELKPNGGTYIDFADSFRTLDYIIDTLQDDPAQFLDEIREYYGYTDDWEPDDLWEFIEDDHYDIADSIAIPEEETMYAKMEEALRQALYDVDLYDENAHSLMRAVMDDHYWEGDWLDAIVVTLKNKLTESEASIDTGTGLEYASGEITRRMLRNMGYDGIIVDAGAQFPGMEGTGGATHYLVFEPTQVKSVFNMGDYDPTNPDIYYQRSLPTTPERGWAPDLGVNVTFSRSTERSAGLFDETLVPILESDGGAFAIAEDPVGGFVLDSVWGGQTKYDTLHEARTAAWEEAFTRARNRGERMFQEVDPAQPWYYSHARKIIEERMPSRQDPVELFRMLKKGGVKDDELIWTGLDVFLVERMETIEQARKMHIVQVDEGFGTTEAFGSTEKRWRVVDDTETVVPFIPGTEDMRDYVAIYSFATEAQARSFLYEWQNLTKDQILQWMDRSEIRVEETLFGPPEGVDADWVMRYRQTSDAHVKLHDAVIQEAQVLEPYIVLAARYLDLDVLADDGVWVSQTAHNFMLYEHVAVDPKLDDAMAIVMGEDRWLQAQELKNEYLASKSELWEMDEVKGSRVSHESYTLTPEQTELRAYRELLLQWDPRTSGAQERLGRAMLNPVEKLRDAVNVYDFAPHRWDDIDTAATNLFAPEHFRDKLKYVIERRKWTVDNEFKTTNLFETGHWEEPNVLAHVRFADYIDSEGNKVLYLDEIQSDWHQQGRTTGYKQPAEFLEVADDVIDEWVGKLEEAWDAREKLQPHYERWMEFEAAADELIETGVATDPVWHVVKDEVTPEGKTLTSRFKFDTEEGARAAVKKWGGDPEDIARRMREQIFWSVEEMAVYTEEYSNARRMADNFGRIYEAAKTKADQKSWAFESYDPFARADSSQVAGQTMPAPFSKNRWGDLTMKRMLRWAAEHGYDRIAWSTGRIQNERWNLANYFSKIEWSKHFTEHTVDASGTPVGSVLAEIELRMWDTDGNQGGYQRVGPDRLREYVGDNIAENILGSPDDFGVLQGKEDMAVGKGGMEFFYDKYLTKTMAKMGKKYKSSPQPVHLATDLGGSLGTQLIDTQSAHVKIGWNDRDGNFHVMVRNNQGFWDQQPARGKTAREALDLNGYQDISVQYGDRHTTVHGMDITPEMRQSVLRGQPLFSQRKGAVQFLKDGKAVIYALENPDISTLVHELGHVFRLDLRRTISQAADDATAARLTADFETASKWAGVVLDEDGEYLWSGEAAYRHGVDSDQYRAAIQAEEKFARGFEEYLMEGKAPSPELVPVFEKFKEWLAHIYARVKGQLAGVTPEMKGVYDRLLAEFPEANDYPITTEMGRAKVPTQANMFQPAPPLNSQNFMNWFGDSKVVNANGSPMAVYHGTRAEFAAFDPDFSSDFGYHFGTQEQAARRVGTKVVPGAAYEGANIHEVYLSIENPLRVDDFQWQGAGLQTLVEANLDTPAGNRIIGLMNDARDMQDASYYVYRFAEFKKRGDSVLQGYFESGRVRERNVVAKYAELFGSTFDEVISDDLVRMKFQTWLKKQTHPVRGERGIRHVLNDAIIEEFEKLGYDGMVYINKIEGEGDSWIAFRPEQVKSVRNTGEFSPTDPNMLHQAIPLEYENGYLTQLLYQDDIPDPTHPLGEVESHTGAPQSRIQDEAMRTHIKPIMSGLEDILTGPEAQVPTANLTSALDDATMRQLRAYTGEVYGDLADTKLAGVRWAENRRDAALLNYSRRYGFDNVLTAIFPYQFWYTRSAMQWAIRAIDKPGWLANYARIRNFQRKTVQSPGFPRRLVNKSKIPIPFLPEWAGGGMYIDPFRQIFPFEQFARPWEQRSEEQNMIEKRTVSTLQYWAEDGEESAEEVQEAVETRSGPLWDKAYNMAKLDVESQTSNPWDFMNLIMSPSLPLGWIYNAATGNKDKISQMPASRLIQNVSGALGANQGRGFNIEGPIRRAFDMPEIDRYHDYRVDRSLSDLAAEGLITPEAATLAMNEQSGDAFLMAQQRAAQTQQIKYLGAPLGADLFPEGEQRQRAIAAEYDVAREAWLEGDDDALQKFFDEYPEYEARKMSFIDDPEERLRTFLRSSIWEAYYELPDLTRRQLREQLGDVFTQAFLNKETRSYDSIDTPTLTQWAQVMKGVVPETAPEVPEAQVTLASKEETEAYQTFVDKRNLLFPGIGEMLGALFEAPEAEQDAIKQQFPQIDDYYTWRNEQFANKPEIIPYAMSEKSKMYGAPPDVQVLYYQFQTQRDYMFPDIFEIQENYFLIDEEDKKAKKAYREQFPQLVGYWDWRREFMRQYPNMIPYLMSEESLAEAVLGEERGGQPISQAPVPGESPTQPIRYTEPGQPTQYRVDDRLSDVAKAILDRNTMEFWTGEIPGVAGQAPEGAAFAFELPEALAKREESGFRRFGAGFPSGINEEQYLHELAHTIDFSEQVSSDPAFIADAARYEREEEPDWDWETEPMEWFAMLFARAVTGNQEVPDYMMKWVSPYVNQNPYNIDVNQLDPALARMLTSYYMIDEPLGGGAQKALVRLWNSLDQPGENFEEFLEVHLKNQF